MSDALVVRFFLFFLIGSVVSLLSVVLGRDGGARLGRGPRAAQRRADGAGPGRSQRVPGAQHDEAERALKRIGIPGGVLQSEGSSLLFVRIFV